MARSQRSNSSSSESSISTSSTSSTSSSLNAEDVFIYSRVSNLPPTFGTKDLISCCSMGPNVFVYATHSGLVHLSTPEGTTIRTVRVHRASVLGICSDSKFVATASIDGTVVIASVTNPQDVVQASFKRPVHCIALHPDYENNRQYISGGTAGQVVLSERGWLKNRKDTVLVSTKSTILEMKWVQSRIVFCNEDGISIYNSDDNLILNRIPLQAQQPIADLYRPRISIHDDIAVVAWAKFVYLVSLIDGKLQKMFSLSAPCAGAFVYKTGNLVVLLVDEVIELKLVNIESGMEIYDDEIELRGNLEGCNGYHLQLYEQLFIVSSCDVVRARERTIRDHLAWLIEHSKYVEAYYTAREMDREQSYQRSDHSTENDDNDLSKLGALAADQLLNANQFGKLSELLPQIITTTDDWTHWTKIFISRNEFRWLAKCIPAITGLGEAHEKTLEFFIKENDYENLKTCLSTWPLQLYDGYKLAELLKSKNDETCYDILVDIYLNLKEYTLAVHVLVKMDSPRAYEIVQHYHLWSEESVLENLSAILTSGDSEIGGDYVSRLQELIASRAEIPPSKVIPRLNSNNGENDILLFGYLSELGRVDDTYPAQYADIMVKLYSKYDPKKLLSFLIRYDSYDFDQAIKICEKNNFINELVYLLGQVGSYTEALDLIVTKLRDLSRATEFARVHNIWDKLLPYTVHYPALVLELLKCVELSPTLVLNSVPGDMKIRGLKSALCGVIIDQDVNLALSEGALQVVKSEAQLWTDKYLAQRRGGTNVDEIDKELPVLVTDDVCVHVSDENVNSFAEKLVHYAACIKMNM